MISITIKRTKENRVMEKFKEMAQQSLAPDSYEMFVLVYNQILKNRGLTIEPI